MMEAEKIYRVLITGPPLQDKAMATLQKRASCRSTPLYPTLDQIAAMAAEDRIEGLIVRQGDITREVLEASTNLRVIVKHGVGVDNIDVEAATELGIAVCITANANFNSVAEHALAMMFALAKHLCLFDRQIHGGLWKKGSILGTELLEKCLGIIGIGRIGKRLAELVQPLNMTVIGYDPYLPENWSHEKIRRIGSLEEILREADFVSMHCPKTPETTNIIGEKEFKIMKPTAVLINTARGGIIDEWALVKALQEGQIRGAALDCFSMEPLPSNHPLTTIQDRLVLTPHAAGGTEESRVRMGVDAVRMLLDHLDGKKLAPGELINPGALARQ